MPAPGYLPGFIRKIGAGLPCLRTLPGNEICCGFKNISCNTGRTPDSGLLSCLIRSFRCRRNPLMHRSNESPCPMHGRPLPSGARSRARRLLHKPSGLLCRKCDGQRLQAVEMRLWGPLLMHIRRQAIRIPHPQPLESSSLIC
jgi:hypothetical protein